MSGHTRSITFSFNRSQGLLQRLQLFCVSLQSERLDMILRIEGTTPCHDLSSRTQIETGCRVGSGSLRAQLMTHEKQMESMAVHGSGLQVCDVHYLAILHSLRSRCDPLIPDV